MFKKFIIIIVFCIFSHLLESYPSEIGVVVMVLCKNCCYAEISRSLLFAFKFLDTCSKFGARCGKEGNSLHYPTKWWLSWYLSNKAHIQYATQVNGVALNCLESNMLILTIQTLFRYSVELWASGFTLQDILGQKERVSAFTRVGFLNLCLLI